MSLSTSIYLGPYFLCVTRQVPYLDTQQTCVSTGCVARGQPARTAATHCSLCGEPLQEKTIEEQLDEVAVEDVEEDLHEQLYSITVDTNQEVPPGTHLWLPNVYRKQPRVLQPALPVAVFQDLSEPCQHAEAHWLLKAFHAEHLVLDKHYGKANVAVRWGLLVWRW
jgi:hypothetical protein